MSFRASKHWLALVMAAWLMLSTVTVFGQTPSDTESADEPVVKNSSVGYIDSAIPMTQFRLRYDSAYRFARPSRAEFFYAQGGPGNPGLPRPETGIDYQELSAYLEWAASPWFSAFVEAPIRFLQPNVNASATGFSDVNAGIKWAVWETSDSMVTFQFRVFSPTGDARRGLGTHHVSLEPAFLGYYQLMDKVALEGEFRYWAPIGGTDFAGEILRYGVGVSYGNRNPCGAWVTPVVELVGWSVLSGKEPVVLSPTLVSVKNAGGDTIVNVKAGLRFGFGERMDFYGGYGRAITGDTWYEDIWRLEMRLRF